MSAPVGYTCPMIDEIKADFETFYDLHFSMEEASRDELDSAVQTLFHHLYGKRCTIEKIRGANAALRDWGETMEENLDQCLRENEELQDTIDSLEQKYT